jgi:hypothetical protein
VSQTNREGGSNNGTVRPSHVEQLRKPCFGAYTVLTRKMSDSLTTRNSHVVCSLQFCLRKEIFIRITAAAFYLSLKLRLSPDESDVG